MELFRDKTECCGCTACYICCPQNAITLVEDNEGFLYPHIDNALCVNCNLCIRVCPNNKEGIRQKRIPQVYATQNLDNSELAASTSGGIFTVFAKKFITNGGVVYGAAISRNFSVEHIRITNLDEIQLLRGSKYVQSNLGDVFSQVKNDLEDGKLILFCGTPCQVAGLINSLRKTKRDRLYTIDLICHGVPSRKIFIDYIRFIELKRKSKIQKYYFRTKDHGWKYGSHIEKTIFANGKIDSKSLLSQAYARIFESNHALRPSCYKCKFNSYDLRKADITIGDFWGYRDNSNEGAFCVEKGVSLTVIHTQKGGQLVDFIKSNIVFAERTIEECTSLQPQFRGVPAHCDGRIQFWNMYYKRGIKAILKKYGKWNTLEKAKIAARKVKCIFNGLALK